MTPTGLPQNLIDLLTAMEKGGQPNGNLAKMPPILEGLGGGQPQPFGLLQSNLSPEMLSLLGPVGATPAGLKGGK